MRLLARFSTDPGWHHERILCWPVSRTRWVILTGDGDLYDESLKDYAEWMIMSISGGSYPVGVVDVVAFETVPERSQLYKFIKTGSAEAKRICAAEGLTAIEVKEWVDDEGKVSPISEGGLMAGLRRTMRLRSKTPGAKGKLPPSSPPRTPDRVAVRFDLTPGAAEGEDDDGKPSVDELWVVCDACCSRIGVTTEVVDGDGDEQYALKEFDGTLLPCRRFGLDKAASFIDNCRKNLDALCEATPTRRELEKGDEPEQADRSLAGLATRLRVGEVAVADAGDDIRTLAVDYDSHGHRWKDFREVAAEMKAHSFPDWCRHLPEGPNMAFEMLSGFQRTCGGPRKWLTEWLRDRSIGSRERTAIEMKVLTDSLDFGGSYDQLNLSALLSVEVLCRRIAQIIEAYDTDPARPNWAGVRHMLGDANTLNVVPQQAKSYNARRIKDELEIETARARMQGSIGRQGDKQGGHDEKQGNPGGKSGGGKGRQRLTAADAV